jgi:6-phosphogluconolactonase
MIGNSTSRLPTNISITNLLVESSHRTIPVSRMKNPLLQITLSLTFLCNAVFAAEQNSGPAGECLVYVGTYTGAKSKGIYAFRLNLAKGSLTPAGLAAETTSPSFLALDPTGHFLYAANEVSTFNGKPGGAVSAFSIDRTSGKLTLLNQQTSGGAGPCHLFVDKNSKAVLVANYTGGSVEVIPIGDHGRLGEPSAFLQHKGSSVNANRQKEPHAHSINVDAGNRFAVAADLGLDKLLVYKFDADKGTLTPNDPPFTAVKAGAGPRHFAFHPNGRFAYAINELHSTLTAFSYDSNHGVLAELETLPTIPQPVPGNSTAEVQVHPSGKFVYGSNRGHNSIAVFQIDSQLGRMKYVENESTQGKTPRNFGIDPTGTYLLAANQDSDSIVVFRIDQTTGELTPTGQKVEAPTPVCVKFLRL